MNKLYKRLDKDYNECINAGIEVIKDINDNNILTCVIKGLENTEYDSGIFKLKVKFNCKYPFEPPEVSFIDKIFHPNISFNYGTVCVDILQINNWSPALSLYKILLSIQSLLTDPNPESPLNLEAAFLYKTNREEYKKMCQKYISNDKNKI